MSDDHLDIVFLAVGYGRRYENLLCTYAACVLETVPRSGVEMIVLGMLCYPCQEVPLKVNLLFSEINLREN